MKNLFDLIYNEEKDNKHKSLTLGLRLAIAGREALCPISNPFESYEAFETECRELSDALEQVKRKARRLFTPQDFPSGLRIAPDAQPEDIWRALSSLQEEEEMVHGFNALEPSQRQAVAEHVLSHCNVFSGKGAAFSRRYDAETGLMV